jgi:site-specific DNA recombinase
MGSAATPRKRCAIYTRKSSEEGLEQEFNSLDAQRVACEAFVQSQAGEGWIAARDHYDDGGFSGGSMDRPGLRRLLADVVARKIDIVVVYKVDRLTRSLMDFSRIVERFDANEVSFVSVTQAFNTTSSMGRLTLNVLLSFAQFEREVTGERIRDKIALSKARGIWMGGMVPLGYDLKDRRLSINEGEAQTVRLIFARYLELRSVNALRDWLEDSGVRSKSWMSRGGRQMGGVVLGRGAIFHVLRNRLYLGEIPHKGEVHPGRHEPIVDRETFDRARALLDANRAGDAQRPVKVAAAVLTGLVYDADGRPFSPSSSYGKSGRLYRYYLAADLQTGHRRRSDDDRIRRVNGEVLEVFARDAICRIAERPDISARDLPTYLRRLELRPSSTELLLDARALFGPRSVDLSVREAQARLAEDEELCWDDDPPRSILRLKIPVRFQMRGGRTWIEGGRHPGQVRRINRGLVQALKSAHLELHELAASPLTPLAGAFAARAPDDQHRRQVSRLAFLAPDLQQMILDGRQPAALKLRTLLKAEPPLLWTDQRRWFANFG